MNRNIDTGSVNAGPVVAVPTDPAMRDEPARAIAKAKQVKSAIAAILTIAGVTIAPQLDTQIDQLIQLAIVVAFGVYELYQAYRQGEETRESVYSPAKAAEIAKATNVAVVPGDPKNV